MKVNSQRGVPVRLFPAVCGSIGSQEMMDNAIEAFTNKLNEIVTFFFKQDSVT